MRGEFDTSYKEEVSAKTVDGWLEEFRERFSRLPAEQRAYKVISAYMSLDEPSDAVHDKFVDWLMDDRDAGMKESALERVFEEMLCKSGRTGRLGNNNEE